MRVWALGSLFCASFTIWSCSSDPDPSGSAGQGGTSASSSASSSTTASGGMGGMGGSGGGPTAGYCAKGCAMPADCCQMNESNCPSDTYPKNYTCDNGVCGPPQCKVKDDCTAGGALPDYDCKLLNGFATCIVPCTSDAPCGMAKCTGVDDMGGKYCKAATSGGCTDDASCNGFGKCSNGKCVCDVDADCTSPFGNKCVTN